MSRNEKMEHIQDLRTEILQLYKEYWSSYTDFSSWGFWVVTAMLVIPLIVFYFKVDRDKLFFIGFYGFSVHMLMSYLDALGLRHEWWDYPYFITPYLPGHLGLDASFIPVYFMLLYQWCLNKKKSHWIYVSISNVFFTFIMKPLMIQVNLFDLYVNIFGLLAAYFFVTFGAKIITNIFIKMAGLESKFN